MALFDKVKKMLISGKGREQIICSVEKQNTDSKDSTPTNGKQTNISQSDRQMRVSRLTPREHDLYLLLLEGFTLKESAKQLSIKYSTANTHMSGVYRKLGVNSRAILIINYRGIGNEKTLAHGCE